ncbi:MAG TPA: Gfo/Idh/MocA family oxidoreductase [Candidatus Acidoferrum sp.]|jgi:predicted dehydrogenase
MTSDDKKNEERQVSRRQLLKTGVGLVGAGLTGAGMAVNEASAFAAESAGASAAPAAGGGESVVGLKFEARDTVRLGVIGVGGRGTGMLSNFLAIPHVQVNAICDSNKEHATHAQELVEKSGGKKPEIYANGEHDYENLCKRNDLDFIYIATPWQWHAPMGIAAMKGGAHAGLEVPAVNTVEECQQIVDVSEKTRRHCMIMENCCYGQSELLVLNMVRAGVFGELLHGEGAYIHDLRKIVFEDRSEGLWRRDWHTKVNGNMYPTHGLGPVASYMGINRGDRFDYIVSMSSPQAGLDAYRAATVPKDSPKWKEKYICGDMNTSLIKTTNGLSIVVQHDVSNPHPYDRVNLIKGVKGMFRGYPDRIFIDGQKGEEAFTGLDAYREQYEHKLWKEHGKDAEDRGHGGMDYLMLLRLVQCIREGLAPDIDVYDAASWSAIAELSEKSVAQGSAPQKFPDFTHGDWKQRKGSAL